MSNERITVVAKFLAKEGKGELVKSEFLKLIEPTRREEGCINYDLHQDNSNPNLFLFYENWASKEHLQKHLNSSHIKEYRVATKGFIEEFTFNQMTIVK